MGKNTPALDSQDEKKKYIEKHLFDELRYMLAAATEWSIQHQLNLEIPGYEVQVYAMDSAFLRARVLFEFFVGKKESNHYCSHRQFGIELHSKYYTNDWSANDWSVPLHRNLMHAQDRSRPGKLNSPDGPKHLNEMPVYFAKEVLKLDASADREKRELGQITRDRRMEAIRAAECVINSEVAQYHAKSRGQTLRPVFS
jgi:hypothetical protein